MLEHERMSALGLLQGVPDSSIPMISLPISFDGDALGATARDLLFERLVRLDDLPETAALYA